jgi:hypothetical protein
VPNTKLSSLTLWIAFFGTVAPFACTASECDGPGGLCIDPLGDDGGDGEPGGVPNGAGAPNGGASSGSTGTEGGAPQGGSGAEGGNPSPGGADGTGGMADGGESYGGTGTGGTGTGGAGSARGGMGGTGMGGTTSGGTGAGATAAIGGTATEGGAPSGGRGGAGPLGGAGPAGGLGPGGGAGTVSGKAGAGAGTSGKGDLLCPSPDSFYETCGGAGGTGGDDYSGYCDVGTSASESVELGAGGMGSVLTVFPLDDFEDGDVLTEPIFGGRGIWYTANDGSGLQFPEACTNGPAYGIFPIPGGKAFHTYGRDFVGSVQNGNLVAFAQVGVSLRSSPPACERPLDASRADGIRFRAKGSVAFQSVSITLFTVATNPREGGGTCTSNCWQGFITQIPVGPDFQEYSLPFSNFAPGPYPFDPATLMNITWNGQVPCFDFWIDDVAFYGYE